MSPAFRLANSPENLCPVRLFLTAIQSGWGCPTTTTKFSPGVLPMDHQTLLWRERQHDYWMFGLRECGPC